MSSSDHRLERGQNAHQILQDETLRSALALVRDRGLRSLREAENPEQAWNARALILAADDLVGTLRGYLQDGRAAARQMSEKERQAEGAAEYAATEEDMRAYLSQAEEARKLARAAGIATRGESAVQDESAGGTA